MSPFLKSLAGDFAIAMGVALVIDAPALVDVGSTAQLTVLGVAALRSSVKAGLAAVTPRLLALRDKG